MVSEQTKKRSPLFQGLLPIDRAGVPAEVLAELDRYGIVELLGADAFFDTLSDTVAAFRHTTPSP